MLGQVGLVGGVLLPIGVGALAVVGALLVAAVIGRVTRRVGRRVALVADLSRHAHRPVQWLLVVTAVRSTITVQGYRWPARDVVLHVLDLALIGVAAWLVAALLVVVEDAALARVRTDVRDNLHARRVHTQVNLVRRITVALVGLVAIGAMLITFPAARAAGASLLASAGIAGAIAALAAQSLLSNVFAGLQIAFSNAVRLDDVVIVEKEWGRVEEITLTYLVVHLWDDRRLVVPTSYFMSKPFQNWTRQEAALLGTVELDLDWSVPVEELREQLRVILRGSELWDERVSVLQVTDAVNFVVRVRALVSAADAPTLFDLRCLVRERLVDWVRRTHPEALPRVRHESRDIALAGPTGPTGPAGPEGRSEPDSRAFGETPDGQDRAALFSGPDRP